MRTHTFRNQGCRGYTLQELVGTLAVILMLATALVPGVLSALDDARLAADVASINALTVATRSYYEKYGQFAGVGAASIATWDHNAYEYWERNVLLREGFIETTFKSKLGTAGFVRLVKVTTTSTTTDILTEVGQVGHIPGFNGNNGYYNLTQGYTANTQPESRDGFARMATGPTRWRSAGEAVLSTVFSGWPARLHWRSHRTGLVSLAGGLRWPNFHAGTRLVPAGNAIWRRIAAGWRGGVGPLQCCYPITAGWQAPTPGMGSSGGATPGNPSHANPGADTQITARAAGTPAIVAEVVLEGVSVVNAYKLSLAIDGRIQSNWAFFDSLGRVKYDMYNSSGGAKTGVVMIYLGHK